MKDTEKLLAEFKKLSSSVQLELLQSLRSEFEDKGKLLEVVESELTIKKP